MKSPRCSESGLQVVTVATKQKPFDLYRPAKGLRRVAEMFQKCRRIVANLTQNTEVLFRFYFVSIGRTRLYEAFDCGVTSVAGNGQICILQRVLLPVRSGTCEQEGWSFGECV